MWWIRKYAISDLSKKYGNLKREISKRKLACSSDSDDSEVLNTSKTVFLNNPRKKTNKGSDLIKNPGFVKKQNSLGTRRKDALSRETLVAEPNVEEPVLRRTVLPFLTLVKNMVISKERLVSVS